jgi:hypothetical protein
MFSTPVKLNNGQNTLAGIFDAASLANISIAYSWSNGRWNQVNSAYVLAPLSAICINVSAGTTATATCVPSTGLSEPPSVPLTAGLNLIGPAPGYANGSFGATPLTQALVSCAQAPGNVPGYIMVISPAINQPGWTYSVGGQSQDLAPYKGYWVIMMNPATLYGSSTTPIQ